MTERQKIPAGFFQVPALFEQRLCRSCGARIVWIRTATGAAMPLDLDSAQQINGERWAPIHFARCPHAGQWRRK